MRLADSLLAALPQRIPCVMSFFLLKMRPTVSSAATFLASSSSYSCNQMKRVSAYQY
jgi:hypothetical protein